ncbi:MAG: manganese efflux pump [Erysipelotrichales bacterium]|nr:manganese efflux pump [Erysipelotrichales bacterium]MBQ4011601.1 manganese efflux pump [Erysipelotrichales bacterium]MBQ4374436.1 manganese efflux pump [Erysipelotrichales bacterium]
MNLFQVIVLYLSATVDSLLLLMHKGATCRQMSPVKHLMDPLACTFVSVLAICGGYGIAHLIGDLKTNNMEFLVISILLILFGAVLIRRGRTNEDIPERVDDSFTVKKVIVRSLITNLDAVLVSFCVALRNVPFFEALIIGVIANFLASFAGLEIGYRHGYVMRKIPMVSGILMLIFGVYFAVLSV